jgi:hypothetical protein
MQALPAAERPPLRNRPTLPTARQGPVAGRGRWIFRGDVYTMSERITYQTDGPTGIYVMYLCDEIPSAIVTHDQGVTYVTVPDADNAALLEYFRDRGYEHTVFKIEASPS